MFVLLFSSLLFSSLLLLFSAIVSERACAQGEQNSFWLNRGDGNSPQFDPSQGEFHPDVGGFLELDRYQGTHPYASLRAQIEALFFNPNGLHALLPGGLQDLDIQLLSQGTYDVEDAFTSNTLNYETLIINGASVIIVWDPIAMAALGETPQVTMVFSPTNGGPHSGPSGFFVQVGSELQPKFGTNPEAYLNYWDGRPHGPSEATVNAGHFLVQFQPNRWPDVLVAFKCGRGLGQLVTLRSK